MSEATDRDHGLYLDEDALGLGRYLRGRGWDIHRCTQSGLTGTAATDPKQLDEAVRLRRVLVSANRPDFELVHEAWILAGGDHTGILSIRGGFTIELAGFADAIDSLLRSVTPNDLRNSMRIWHPNEQEWHDFEP